MVFVGVVALVLVLVLVLGVRLAEAWGRGAVDGWLGGGEGGRVSSGTGQCLIVGVCVWMVVWELLVVGVRLAEA